METLHRVDASLLIKTVSLLTEAAELHRRMRIQIDTDVVNTGTSWTTAFSKLLTSLGDMKGGHIADSMSLLSTLNDVYLTNVDNLVTGLSKQLQDCDRLTAEAFVIVGRWLSPSSVSDAEVDRLQLLLDRFRYLDITLSDFEFMMSITHNSNLRYFPGRVKVDCIRLFGTVVALLNWQIEWLDVFVSNISTNTGSKWPIDTIILVNMTVFRSGIADLSECLLSYEKELNSFEGALLTLSTMITFNYELPTASLRKFNMDSHWLDTIASQYISNSVSKLNLAKALHANGSEVLTNADQLYSDMELSLFSKVSDHIDNEEDNMVSFYGDLLRRVTSLQRYMFPNDTSLQHFMRSLSIWRMPIVNFQKSQVLFILLVTPAIVKV